MFKDFLVSVIAAMGLTRLINQPRSSGSNSGLELLPPVEPASYDQADLDALARTIWGEARGEGYYGMVAVANVIMNRYAQAQNSLAKSRQFGATVEAICKKPYQFSVWNANDPNFALITSVTTKNTQFARAIGIARKALNGQLDDITHGADHYHTNGVAPSWSRGVSPIATIGNHKFFDLA